MTDLGLTPSQTAGPYLGIGMPWPHGPYAVPEGTPGAVWLRGTIYDGAGEVVLDAVVETWQSDAGAGAAAGAEGRGFGRSATDTGGFAILFAKPGTVPGPDGTTQAPHLAMSVFARGLLDRVVTRVYFDDESAANAADPILSTVDDDDRRRTLIATREADGYRFDIRLQGDGETVFFDV